MARKRPLFGRMRGAGRRLFAATRQVSRRLRRGRRSQRPSMGLVGKIGAGLTAVPLVIAAIGNGSTIDGAIGLWRKGHPIEVVLKEFADVLAIQYAGRKLDGIPYSGAESYSGWRWLGYGAGLMLGDALAGKLARRLGVRAPRLPLVGRTISG